MRRAPGAASTRRANRISTKAIDRRSEEAFRVGFRRLQAYVRRHGCARPPSKYRDNDGYALGSWTWVRRQMYRRGQLPAHQAQALTQLPGWSWVPHADHFATGVRLLTAYAKRHGHVFVPAGHVEEGFPLGAWAAGVRSAARSGRLAPARRKVIQRIPHWATTRQPDYSRDVARLRRFQARHGHLRISHGGADRALARRTQALRRLHVQGRLAGDVAADLESIPGWSWTPKTDGWARGLAAFRAFCRETGHGKIPENYRHGGVHLRPWVRTQRVRYRKGELPPEQIEELEREPHWTWAPENRRWMAALEALRAFTAREGHAQPHKDAVEHGINIGTWVVTVRKRHRQGHLTPDQVREVEGLRGWSWRPRAAGWPRGLEAFRAFVAREGHARLALDHREGGVSLASWVNAQRRNYRAGRLTPDQVHQLEASPLWVWDPGAARWSAAIAALGAFANREGHIQPARGHSESGIKLHAWIETVRRRHQRGRLTPQQLHDLRGITGWQWGSARQRGRAEAQWV